MSEDHRQIEIKVDSDGFVALSDALMWALCAPWLFRGRHALPWTPDGKSLTFVCEGLDLPKANLILTWGVGRAGIGNVIPLELEELSVSQYNEIVDDFCERILTPAASRLGLTLVSTTSGPK